MRNKITCDTCDENITFWSSLYKTTYRVMEEGSLGSSSTYDFCCINCLLSYYADMKERAGTGKPDGLVR